MLPPFYREPANKPGRGVFQRRQHRFTNTGRITGNLNVGSATFNPPPIMGASGIRTESIISLRERHQCHQAMPGPINFRRREVATAARFSLANAAGSPSASDSAAVFGPNVNITAAARAQSVIDRILSSWSVASGQTWRCHRKGILRLTNPSTFNGTMSILRSGTRSIVWRVLEYQREPRSLGTH